MWEKIKNTFISDIKSWLSRFKKFISRTAFFTQYYTKKLFFQVKKRAPSLKKLHIDSFPAIHLKRMDWMDFLLKFSGEILVVILSLCVAGLNIFYFAGSAGANFQDGSLAQSFLNNHVGLNQELYAKNTSIVTVVSQNSFIPQAQADDFTGLDSQNISGNDPATSGDNGIVMSDDNSILAPNPDSINSAVANTVTNYVTQAGDTLQSIAQKFGVSTNTIRWSNPGLTSSSIEPGWNLLIPPIDGVVVVADDNTTLPDLAVEYSPDRYNTNATVRANSAAQLLASIISYNGLDSAEDINGGQVVIIPGGVVATPPAPPAPPKSSGGNSGSSNNNYNNAPAGVTSISPGYDGTAHYFPVGYCTYYVATQMKITFGGNAKNWIANALASHYVVNKEPAVHTAVVFSGYGYGRYGHVAYVESVNGDGTITVSEMNYDHFNRVDTRTVPINSPAIKGYIYP
jgi:surface antigen